MNGKDDLADGRAGLPAEASIRLRGCSPRGEFERRRGFTIVELLIYSGILVIFLYVMTSMFTAILDTKLESETASALITDGQYLFSRLAHDIERADILVTPAALGEQSADLTLRIGGADYMYTATSGNLELTNNIGTFGLTSYGTTISNLSFRRYGNVNGKHSVRIVFRLTSTTERPGGADIRDFETTISMRK